MVGHNPNLTQFLGQLLAGPTEKSIPGIRLRKGSIARISIQRGATILQYLLDPRIIRALYATSTSSSRRKTSRK